MTSPGFKVMFITILPSPYQRDLFNAIAARGDVDIDVYYLESKVADSPWPEMPLRPFERILPGFSISVLGARLHYNWGLPNLRDVDLVVLSSFVSFTGQRLLRGPLRKKRWLYWGEQLRTRNWPRAWIQKWLAGPLARSAGIVGIGKNAENDYRARFPNVPHFNIPYHCDLKPLLVIERTKPRCPTFLFCGQMIERKGVDLLLQAFDRIVRKGIDVELLLVGREADLPRFLKTVSEAARLRIQYAGFQDPADLPQFFARCDIFVLPSRYDGWGVVINQALAAGLPVISTNSVGAAQDLIRAGYNGILVQHEDVDALQDAMETLALNSDMAERYGKNARQSIENFTAEAGAVKWLNVFRRYSC